MDPGGEAITPVNFITERKFYIDLKHFLLIIIHCVDGLAIAFPDSTITRLSSRILRVLRHQISSIFKDTYVTKIKS